MRRGLVLSVFFALTIVLAFSLPFGASGSTKKFQGVQLTLAGESGLTINPMKWHRGEWGEMTGANINIVEHPFASLFEKIMTSFVTGTAAYDIIVYPSAWSGDIMGGGYVLPLTKYLKDNPDWDDILPLYRERIAAWGNTVYAFPLDGDSHMLYYRKDLIENPKYKADFKKKYGYDLQPPKTWKMYKDIAEFFTGWDWDGDGKPNYGVVESMARGGQSYWWFFSHSAAYVAIPGQVSLFFDPDNMKPLINSPGHVQGLQDYVDMVKYGPPGMLNYQVGDVRSEYPLGTAALAIDWGDVGTMANDPKLSKVVGKVGYLPLPGSTRVWNRKTGKWEDFPEINYAPYIAFGGWVASITKTCKNPDAAYDFLRYLNSPAVSLKDVTTGGSGFNPYRKSHFEAVQRWREFGFPNPEEYLQAIRFTIEHPNAQLDLRIPGAAEYFEVLDLNLSRALSKEVTPKQALDAVYQEWEKITNKLGREKQLRYYRESLGLPPK
ncbi:MAG TPA: extracellular solute-binding protein [Firmicutes bacterium]|nr:extracellular solute-binding protein [Bacillota bacterium]